MVIVWRSVPAALFFAPIMVSCPGNAATRARASNTFRLELPFITLHVHNATYVQAGLLMVLDPKIIDDLSQRLSNSLPPGLASLEKDARQHLHSALQSALSRMNLVTREEFDIQRAVLARTREKLETLARHVAELEQKGK